MLDAQETYSTKVQTRSIVMELLPPLARKYLPFADIDVLGNEVSKLEIGAQTQDISIGQSG